MEFLESDIFWRELKIFHQSRMADRLKSLQGGFVLSINDRPEIRYVFSALLVEGAELTYSVAGGARAAKHGR